MADRDERALTGNAPVHPDGTDPTRLREAGHHIRASLRAGAGPLPPLLAGEPVPTAELAKPLDLATCRVLERCGVVSDDGTALRSLLRGHLVGDLLVLTDPDVPEEDQHERYVDPLWEADLLARLMLPRTGARALDMGCGSGVLSLVLARLSQQVVGVDINPRAVALSQLNAALNALTNVRFVQGDLYEPTTGTFDRIVFNSPTNEEGDRYRDLLEAGEGILARFFGELPSYLGPAGVVEVNLAMNDYGEPESDDASTFAQRLARWLAPHDRDLRITVVVSQQVRHHPAHVWKRGWLVISPGPPALREVHWPYHDSYARDPGTVDGGVVQLLPPAATADRPRHDGD